MYQKAFFVHCIYYGRQYIGIGNTSRQADSLSSRLLLNTKMLFRDPNSRTGALDRSATMEVIKRCK